MTERELTPQERVDEWIGLYAQFRKTTPSAPDWYQAIDYMVGALMSDHIEALKAKAKLSDPGRRVPPHGSGP